MNPTAIQHLRVALVIGIAAGISVIGVVPYSLALLSPEIREKLPPMWILMTAQVLQALVVFTLMAWAGFVLGWKHRLDAPVVRRMVKGGEPALAIPRMAWPIAIAGGLIGAAAAAAIVAAFEPHMPAMLHDVKPPSSSMGLAASFYGAIAEELQIRLFVMTLLAAGLAWLARGRLNRTAIIAIAALLAALAFGAAHLPAASQVWPLDDVVVWRTVLANAAPGLLFAGLFARFGLEAAILAHFVADLALHVVPGLMV